MVAGGLTAGEAIICVFIAHLLGGITIVINSRFGAVYHIGYPVYQRMSFGPFGSFFPILVRCAIGAVWVGVQLYQGGEFTSVILRCIFGHRWADIPNTIPLKSDITTVNLAATLIFTAVTFPLLFMKVHKTRWLWTIKAFVLPPAVIGLFIYTQVMSSGGDGHNFKTVKHYKGATLAWTMLKFVNSATSVPIINTGVACLGIFATSAVIPFGADMTALAPRILDINRGQALSYVIGLCVCPWYILTSATSFITFLGGYSIFLGPIVGVSGADYFYRRGNVHVPSLYTASKSGHYFYNYGTNWRAFTAFCLGCVPTIPGFAGTFGHKMPIGFIHLFYIGWLYSIVSSALLYWVLLGVTSAVHASAGSQCNATLGVGKAAASDPYWYEGMAHLGGSAYSTYSNYTVYRNVKDYGAAGDGVTDDTSAIQAAIADGDRCGLGCSSSTTTPAVVYFPTGNYLISKPILSYYYTTLLGDAKNRPTVTMASSFHNTGTGFDCAFDADPYIPGGNGANYWQNQNNFFRSIRNFIIDTTAVPHTTVAIGIHWQVAQATSLQDITVKMSAQQGTQHIGIYMENGSGGFMSDIDTHGGLHGYSLGNQQFTFTSLSATGAVNGIYGNNNWGMTFMSTTITDCTNAFYLRTGGDRASPTDGANYILDSIVTNTTNFVLTTTNQASPTATLAGSIVIDHATLSGVTNSVVATDGSVALGGGANIDLWMQGSIYNTEGTRTYSAGTAPAYVKPPGLVTVAGNVYTKSMPQYETYSPSQFISVKASGAKGDGFTDDTAAVQAVFDKYAGCKIIYFDAGTYLLTKTIHIPVGSTVVGEYFPVLLAYGPMFTNESNPTPFIEVGKPGDVGNVEISNMMFSSVGGSSGAIMMEWNVAASHAGAAGLWNTHFRLGGAAGTDIGVTQCSSKDAATDGSCNAAYLALHVTPGSSGMFENVWVWAADHDLDDQAQTQINAYSARGVLIESTSPTWFIGTASEHHTIYQYNLNNASDVFIGLAQTETPYYQPTPAVPSPFMGGNESIGDPTFPADLTSSWALYIQNSNDVLIGGAGFYSFFASYSQTCITDYSCQTQMVNVDSASTNIRMYNLNTVGATHQLSVGQVGIIQAKDNSNGFQNTATFWESKTRNGQAPAAYNPKANAQRLQIERGLTTLPDTKHLRRQHGKKEYHPLSLEYLWLKLVALLLRATVAWTYRSEIPNQRALIPAGVSVSRVNVPSRDKGRSIDVDVYSRETMGASGPRAVHLNFHGSGFVVPWLGSDTAFCARVAAEADVVVLDCDYRKAPEAPFPAAHNVTHDVFAYLLSQPTSFDPTRITASGFSAGASLALTLATTLPPSSLAGVISFYGNMTPRKTEWSSLPPLATSSTNLFFSPVSILEIRD
ncbi:hypothetical protein RQP46_001001 [Phenoliferia psychrophenolica]